MKASRAREDIRMYENLMEDVAAMADMLIGNETIDDYGSGGDYQPFVELVAEFHFNPENDRLYNDLMRRIKVIEKNLAKFRERVTQNHQKGKFIYRNR